MIEAVNRLAGVFTVAAIVIALATLGLLATRRVPGWLRDETALPIATTVAAVATAGSLWMSEVAGYVPCALCWYQRIAMYPLVVVLGVATWRRDAHVWRTAVPLASLGAAVSVWHLVIERNPSLSGPCDPAAPCAVRWVEELGVLTLPAMALAGFAAVIVLTLAARPAGADAGRVAEGAGTEPDGTDADEETRSLHRSR